MYLTGLRGRLLRKLDVPRPSLVYNWPSKSNHLAGVLGGCLARRCGRGLQHPEERRWGGRSVGCRLGTCSPRLPTTHRRHRSVTRPWRTRFRCRSTRSRRSTTSGRCALCRRHSPTPSRAGRGSASPRRRTRGSSASTGLRRPSSPPSRWTWSWWTLRHHHTQTPPLTDAADAAAVAGGVIASDVTLPRRADVLPRRKTVRERSTSLSADISSSHRYDTIW